MHYDMPLAFFSVFVYTISWHWLKKHWLIFKKSKCHANGDL